MKIGNIIVYDIETGGFSKEKNGLAEIAMIGIDSSSLEIVARFETIIAPYNNLNGEQVTYEPQALNVNGLTMQEINAGMAPKDAANEIVKFAKSLRRGSKKAILSGHNIEKFDNPFLDYFLMCHKKDATAHFEKWCIDTMWWSALKHKEGDTADHKLGTVCKAIGIKNKSAHRAMGDTEANAQLLIHYLKGLRGDPNQTNFIQAPVERARTAFQF